mmetsp:Transcript_42008/g.115991  ORF Transcript_42008/g.115991 Transcript_42008/m.115991 type:complete len:255 (-) Transcript_42008:375-1139(-)
MPRHARVAPLGREELRAEGRTARGGDGALAAQQRRRGRRVEFEAHVEVVVAVLHVRVPGRRVRLLAEVGESEDGARVKRLWADAQREEAAGDGARRLQRRDAVKRDAAVEDGLDDVRGRRENLAAVVGVPARRQPQLFLAVCRRFLALSREGLLMRADHPHSRVEVAHLRARDGGAVVVQLAARIDPRAVAELEFQAADDSHRRRVHGAPQPIAKRAEQEWRVALIPFVGGCEQRAERRRLAPIRQRHFKVCSV